MSRLVRGKPHSGESGKSCSQIQLAALWVLKIASALKLKICKICCVRVFTEVINLGNTVKIRT